MGSDDIAAGSQEECNGMRVPQGSNLQAYEFERRKSLTKRYCTPKRPFLVDSKPI